MPTFSVPPITGNLPTNPVGDTMTVAATRQHNAAQPLTVVPAPSYAGSVDGRNWGNWFVEGLTGPCQGLYAGVPVVMESLVTPGLLHLEHVYQHSGSTSEAALAGVVARNLWPGDRGDNFVSPYVTLVPTPRANPASPTLWTGIDLSGWTFHVTATGKVITIAGPSLPSNVFPALGGTRKTVFGTFVNGLFNGPNDIVYHPTNPLIAFVADTFNDRICKIEEVAPGVTEITQYYSGGLVDPYSLAIEADGTLIVADRGNNRVVAISPSLVLSVIGTADAPMVVRRFSDGHLAVAEHGGNRRLLEMNRNTGAIAQIDLIRTPQGVPGTAWLWMDVDEFGTCGPVDDIGTVLFSSYQTFKRTSRDGSFKQYVVRGSKLAHGKLSLVGDPQGHYPWAFAFSDTEAKMVFTGGGSTQIRQWRRLHANDVTTVDIARINDGAAVFSGAIHPEEPALRLCAGFGSHNFTGLENTETLDAMSWDDFAAKLRAGLNGNRPRALTDAQVQNARYFLKRRGRRGLRDGTVDAVGHLAPPTIEDPGPPPPAPTVTRMVAATITAAVVDVEEEDPPTPPDPPDPPLPPPGTDDLDPGIWVQLSVPARTVYQPRLIGSQSIAQGQAGEAQSIAPNPVTETGTMFRSFSGMIAGNGKVWSIGGGHAGHPGNCLDILDLATGQWTLPFPSECPDPYLAGGVPNPVWRAIRGGAVGIGGLSPTGRPWCNHTYRLTAVDAARDRLIWLSGNGLGTYSEAGVWTQLSGKDRALNEPGPTSATAILSDPVRDSIWCFIGDASNGLARGIYEYSIAAGTWRRVQAWPGFSGWGFGAKLMTAVYAPETREAFIMMSPTGGTIPEFPNRLFRYQLDSGILTWEPTLMPGTAVYTELCTNGQSNRRMDFRPASNQLYCYAPPSATVAAGFWVFSPAVGSGGVWQKQLTPDGPGIAQWTLCHDALTDRFIGLRPRTLYCGIGGAACGGIADTHMFGF